MEFALIAVALFLAFNNGANDNFKGFATVWGSDTLSYRQALVLATLATVAGSLASWFLADTLVQQFSGRGLVPNSIASEPHFILSVAFGAAVTVFAATRLGFPISTTHALIGGLVGAGLGQVGGDVNFQKLVSSFFVPLLLSPIMAAGLGLLVYKLFAKRLAQSTLTNDCVCVVPADVPVPNFALTAPRSNGGSAMRRVVMPALVVGTAASCDAQPTAARLQVSKLKAGLHIASAAAICFARGLNDTPKLAALLIAAQVFKPSMSIALVAALMAVGGLVFARRVAETMSQRVNRLDDTQGLLANLVTASLVLMASKFGLPVSTTHVSVGAIAGVGSSAKTLNWSALRAVLLSWVATLPIAAGAAWFLTWVFFRAT